MRGVVMIIMTLDHVRDLMHTTSISQVPTDLSTASPALFFTRWITHLCAPTFVFLSGTSAFLSMKKSGDLAATRRFLLSRGAWLILLDLTLVNFGVWFDLHFSVFLFDVLSAIGIGFIMLALMIRLSTRTIAAIGLAILFLHNLTVLIPASSSPVRAAFGFLFAPGAFPIGSSLFVMGYPPVPWLGVMLLGFAAGKIFELEQAERKRRFVQLGLAAIGLFIIVRAINIYGDTFPWAVQKNALYTVLSFINVTKYPPSLDFCLLFLGIMFLLLRAVQGVQNRWTEAVSVYGKVPLFYFIVHWYLIHPLVLLMVLLQGFKGSDMVFGLNFGRPKTGSGLPLWAIYLVWVGIVLALYPVCRWYGRYKERHREKKWLRYL